MTPDREAWKPTMQLRWSASGKLQQCWWREVGQWGRTFWTPEHEWRDVPTEQPMTAQETRAARPALTVLDKIVTVCGVCERASCWQGAFMCDYAETAGIKNLSVRDLHEKPRGENAEYWFKDAATGEIDRPLLEIYQRMTSGEGRG